MNPKDQSPSEGVVWPSAAFEEWFASQQGKEYSGMYDFAKAAWIAAIGDSDEAPLIQEGARTVQIDLAVFDQPGDPRSNLIARGWTPPGEVEERCEGAAPDCGPVEHWDSEGVPLCKRCYDSLSPGGSEGAL